MPFKKTRHVTEDCCIYNFIQYYIICYPYYPVLYYKSHGRIWLSKKSHCFIYAYKMVQCGLVWPVVVRYGPVWPGVVQCGLVWSGVVISQTVLPSLISPFLPEICRPPFDSPAAWTWCLSVRAFLREVRREIRRTILSLFVEYYETNRQYRWTPSLLLLTIQT